MLFFTLVSAISTALIPRQVFNGISICSSSDSLAKNLVVTISPDPPIVNQEAYLTFEYDLVGSDITGGTIDYNAIINGFFPSDSTEDLCETRNPLSPCPIIGNNTHHIDTGKSTFPDVSSCSLQITWKDQIGSEILCVNLDYAF